MKNNILHTIKLTALYGVAGIMAGGCSYLDVDPELGLTQDEVFETYKNYRSYFDWVYESNGGKNMERIHISFPFYYDLFQSRTFSWYQATDAVDCGLLGVSQLNFKQGILSQELIEQLTFDVSKADYKPIVKAMFSIIRRCNIAIQNIDLCKNATEEERNDLLGQAYFLRAYAHFTLSRQFGGMPYIDHTLEAGDEWDLPRLSNHEAFTRVAEDFYTAYEYFKAAGILRRNSAADLASKKLLEPAGARITGPRPALCRQSTQQQKWYRRLESRGDRSSRSAGDSRRSRIRPAPEREVYAKFRGDGNYQRNHLGLELSD